MIKRIGKAVLAVFLCISCVANVNMFSVGAKTDGIVIDVTEYGADPSGKNDSTEAVKKALKKVKEINGETDKNVVVNFLRVSTIFGKIMQPKENIILQIQVAYLTQKNLLLFY